MSKIFRIGKHLTLSASLLISLWGTTIHAASNGMNFTNESFELSYDANPSELPYLGNSNLHYDLLISNENHPRSVLITIDAEPAKWRKTWPESHFMIAPNFQLLTVDYLDKLWLAPAAGMIARKRFIPLWNDHHSLIEGRLNLSPGFLALGDGGTVWGSELAVTQPILPELSARLGLRFIKAKRDGVNMGKLDQGIFIGMEHNF